MILNVLQFGTNFIAISYKLKKFSYLKNPNYKVHQILA